MTFILGIRCLNGLIVAADSQEEDGIINKWVNKLEIYQTPTWGICWGGAGDAAVVDKFSDKFKQSLRSEPKPAYDRNNVEAVAEACLQHIQAQYQDTIEIVVGLFGLSVGARRGISPEWHLYRASSRNSCMSLKKSHSCIGTGDNSLAHFVLENAAGSLSFLRVTQAEKLATLIVSLMKKYGAGVGGPTRIWKFTNPEMQWIPVLDYQVDELEKEFPFEEFEKAMAEYWQGKKNKNFRQWMDETNRDELDKKS